MLWRKLEFFVVYYVDVMRPKLARCDQVFGKYGCVRQLEGLDVELLGKASLSGPPE